MKNLSKREKIMIGVIVFLLLVGGGSATGCTDDKPKSTENPFIKEIVVKPIEVETIETETILYEEILYEDVSTYWD